MMESVHDCLILNAGPPNTGKPTQVLTRDSTILRAKILKILDQKFFRPSDDINQYDAK